MRGGVGHAKHQPTRNKVEEEGMEQIIVV